MAAAVKAYTVETNTACRFRSTTWVDNCDTLRTTALVVCDGSTAFHAMRLLHAVRLVWHREMEFEVALKLDGDLEAGGRETRDIGATAEAWAAALIR